MIRFKEKNRNGSIELTAKFQNEEIYTRDIDTLKMCPVAGLAPMEMADRRSLTFFLGEASPLRDILSDGCTVRRFLCFLGQMAGLVNRLGKHGLSVQRLLCDPANIYVGNEDELLFLYVPSASGSGKNGLTELLYEMLRLLDLPREQKRDFSRDFTAFLNGMGDFDPKKAQDYILRSDPSVLELLSKKDRIDSGFLTDKQQEYVRHYGVESGVVLVSDEEAGVKRSAYTLFADGESENGGTMVLGADDEPDGGTMVLGADDEPNGGTMVLAMDDGPDGGTMVLNTSDEEEQVKTLWISDPGKLAPQKPPRKEPPAATPAKLRPKKPEKETPKPIRHIPVKVRPAAKLPQEFTRKEPERRAVRYPVLTHVRTGAVITIDKPVFRIGKEKAYVDYFVSNNTTVSRSHVDIIRRGNTWYAKDLNSRNGTFINNRRLIRETENELRDGDLLRLSDEEYVFRT